MQDGLEPFHSDIAFEVIEQELGKPLEQVYSHITAVPVNAASLGQVYKATLADTGETVAVKVQRPGIGQNIAIDMLLLRQLLKAFDSAQDIISQDLVPLVDEFAGRLFGELDYIAEGRNCERFTELYSHMPRIRTPSIQCAAALALEHWPCLSLAL
jgi:aarF domain-containing kinase